MAQPGDSNTQGTQDNYKVAKYIGECLALKQYPPFEQSDMGRCRGGLGSKPVPDRAADLSLGRSCDGWGGGRAGRATAQSNFGCDYEKIRQLWEAQGKDVLRLHGVSPTEAAVENSIRTAMAERESREFLSEFGQSLQDIPDENIRRWDDGIYVLGIKHMYSHPDTEPSMPSQGEEAEAPAPPAAAAALANEAPMPPAEAAPPADLAIPRQLEPPELATSVPKKPPTISEEIERLYNSGVFLTKKANADRARVEMPRRALFDPQCPYFVGTNPNINSKDGNKYRFGMTLVAVSTTPDEWNQLLSSNLEDVKLRNIGRDIGDRALEKMLSLENQYVNETVVQKKARAKKNVNSIGDRWRTVIKKVKKEPYNKTDDEMKQWLSDKLGESSGVVQRNLGSYFCSS